MHEKRIEVEVSRNDNVVLKSLYTKLMEDKSEINILFCF